jgi:hypothetical protein
MFTVAGIATNNKGQTRVRFSTLNLTDTIKRQEIAGNTDIKYVELPTSMTKTDAINYLMGQTEFTAVPAYKAALDKAVGKSVNVAKLGVKMPSKPAPVEIDAEIAKLADETVAA